MPNQNPTQAQGHENTYNRGQNLSAEARSRGGQNSPGNFKNDPQRAAQAGRKGGQSSGAPVRHDDEDEE